MMWIFGFPTTIMLKCGSKARRKARSGEYHECACPRFGPSARVRRTGLGVCRRRDRRPVAAPEETVTEIFLRCGGIGAVRADHGTPGILSDPHRTRYSARPWPRDRRYHPEGCRAGGIRCRRDHQSPAAAGEL